MLLVSHDRDFLDRTVTSTIAPLEIGAGDGRWVEYAGGYSDMLAQRGSSVLSPRKQPKPDAAASREAAAPKAAAKKLSFKQKFALDALPGRMADAGKRINLLEQKLADPAFFAKDAKGFGKTLTELEKERTGLTAMEEEWLELEMLREEMEG